MCAAPTGGNAILARSMMGKGLDRSHSMERRRSRVAASLLGCVLSVIGTNCAPYVRRRRRSCPLAEMSRGSLYATRSL